MLKLCTDIVSGTNIPTKQDFVLVVKNVIRGITSRTQKNNMRATIDCPKHGVTEINYKRNGFSCGKCYPDGLHVKK